MIFFFGQPGRNLSHRLTQQRLAAVSAACGGAPGTSGPLSTPHGGVKARPGARLRLQGVGWETASQNRGLVFEMKLGSANLLAACKYGWQQVALERKWSLIPVGRRGKQGRNVSRTGRA